MKRYLAVLAAATTFFGSGQTVLAETVGKIVKVSEVATIIRNGRRLTASSGFALEVGDTIKTNANGEALVLFVDRTRMVIGNKSSATIQDVDLTSSTRASRLAVRMLGGSYRILTGDSRKQAYEFSTPTATMGVRGTEFDVTQFGNLAISIVSFSGSVRMKDRSGGTATLTGGCRAVELLRGKYSQPDTEEELAAILARDFPYVADQNNLPAAFRVSTLACPPIPKKVKPLSKKQRFQLPPRPEPDASPTNPAPQQIYLEYETSPTVIVEDENSFDEDESNPDLIIDTDATGPSDT
ncbi:MAG: hypothetical protein ACI84R_001038 [Candidatus Azotimanducaceae bacterium]|jgi:hypothetical protein